MKKSSRLPGFYDLSVAERADTVAQWAELTDEESTILEEGLSSAQADQMIENVVGTHALPLGIAANFLINGCNYLIPMAIEEPSVVAGASLRPPPGAPLGCPPPPPGPRSSGRPV